MEKTRDDVIKKRRHWTESDRLDKIVTKIFKMNYGNSK